MINLKPNFELSMYGNSFLEAAKTTLNSVKESAEQAFVTLKTSDFTKTAKLVGREIIRLENKSTACIDSWHKETIEILNKKGLELDEAGPSNKLQELLDTFYTTRIEPILKHKNALKFNAWLDSNGEVEWYKKLGAALAKTPLLAARAILNQVFSVLKALIFPLVHPKKALVEAGFLFVNFLHSLSKPETYSKVGAGVLGTAIGFSLVVVQPPVFTTVAIGLALMGVSMAFEAVRSYANADAGQESKDVRNILFKKHVKQIPAAFATGLLSGLAAGAFQKILFAVLPRLNPQSDVYLKHWLSENQMSSPVWYEYDNNMNSFIVGWGNVPPPNLPTASWSSLSRFGNWHDYYSYLPTPDILSTISKVGHACSQAILATNTK